MSAISERCQNPLLNNEGIRFAFDWIKFIARIASTILGGRMVPQTGDLRMLWLIGYKRNGLPEGLIRLHEFLLRDMIAYFEDGNLARKKIKSARKAVKLSLRMAKKKKIKPCLKMNLARQALGELFEEIEYTRKVVRAAAAEMDSAIRRIEEERVGELLVLIDRANEHFGKKEIGRAMDLLRDSRAKMGNRVLEKTRSALLGGIDSDVKNLKYELQERGKKTSG